MQHTSEIRVAQASGTMVRVGREALEPGTFDGYVLATGPEFYLLELVDDDILLNGYVCMRYEDTDRCMVPCRTHAFQERALALRGIQRPPAPEVDLSSLEALLRSAGERFPVVTVHLDRRYPDTCYIGAVQEVTAERLVLREITTSGVWHEDLDTYELKDILRVDFGGRYEEALVLVADAGGPGTDGA